MNMKKFMAGAVASVMAMSVMAVAASAYNGKMMFADGSWAASDMDDENLTTITGDGTYTVSTNFPAWQDQDTGDETPALANGTTVFCVDIVGLATDKNAGKGTDAFAALEDGDFAGKMAVAKDAGIEVSDVKVTLTDADGNKTDLAVDQSKVYFGDLEGNGNIRIELYNEYGAKSESIDRSAIVDATDIAVTFTITGIDAAADDGNDAATDDGNDAATGDGDAATTEPANPSVGDTSAPTDSNKGNADTGIEGVAIVAGLAIVAAGAVVVAKKRK